MDDWRTQDKLRAALKTIEQFQNKPFPPRSETAAYTIALKSGQKGQQAVCYGANFVYNSKPGGSLYNLKLQPLRLAQSYRLLRRFGADRWLEVTIPSPASSPPLNTRPFGDKEREAIAEWLAWGSHQLLGRSWAPVFTRTHERFVKNPSADGTLSRVYEEKLKFFATHGDEFRPPETPGQLPSQDEALTPEVRTNVNQQSLLRWAVGITKNMDQSALKLFSRLQLSK